MEEEHPTVLVLGVLLTLRYLVPPLQQQVKDTSLKGSFGVTRKEMEVCPSAEQLVQVGAHLTRALGFSGTPPKSHESVWALWWGHAVAMASVLLSDRKTFCASHESLPGMGTAAALFLKVGSENVFIHVVHVELPVCARHRSTVAIAPAPDRGGMGKACWGAVWVPGGGQSSAWFPCCSHSKMLSGSRRKVPKPWLVLLGSPRK